MNQAIPEEVHFTTEPRCEVVEEQRRYSRPWQEVFKAVNLSTLPLKEKARLMGLHRNGATWEEWIF